MSKTRAAKEEWPFCNEHERDRLGRLIDRTHFLRDRIANSKGGTVAYDKGELSALEWVLETVKDHYEHIQLCDNGTEV